MQKPKFFPHFFVSHRPVGSTSFAIFGMVEMVALGNHEEGYRYGLLALKLIDAINCREMRARTYNAVYGFITPYKDPLRDTVAPLVDAYEFNILTGDVEVSKS